MNDWLTPYLTFNGNCEQAVNFYKKVFDAEAQILHFGDAPANPAFPVPENAKNLVLHGEIRKNGHIIRCSDTFPNSPVNAGNNISFALSFDTNEETKATFEALSEGGKIDMPLQETFFSPLYGKITDKFGIMWQIICRK